MTQRPCTCGTYVGPSQPWSRLAGNCYLCWLYDTSPAHRACAPARPLCAHRGPEQGRVDCPSCNGHVEVKTFGCTIHGTCTPTKAVPGAQVCTGCTDYQAPPTLAQPTVRNLLMHLYPRTDGDWRWCVQEIQRRLGLFNGRRIVAVVTDSFTEGLAEVQAAFGDTIDEYLTLENRPELREVLTLEPLLRRVQSRHPSHVTLWCHGIAVTRRGHGTKRPWGQILFEAFLDHWPAVERSLERHPVTGCFKKTGRGWPERESWSDWHYSGSFFAFRSRDLFGQPDWGRQIEHFWSGVESTPARWWRAREAGCLFFEAAVSAMNLYDAEYFRHVVAPAWEHWKVEHQADRLPVAPAAVIPLQLALAAPQRPVPGHCRHLGPATGETRETVPVRSCGVWGRCTVLSPLATLPCCLTCPHGEPS